MKILARKYNIVVQAANDETLVYDCEMNKAYLLNETSAFVWQLCDGQNSVADISRQLAQRFKQTENEDLVWLAIDGLKAKNLLDGAAEIAIPFAAQSRREVIKKVGLTTMIALPMISGLIAPNATRASSRATLPACASCDPNNNQCISGRCVQNGAAPGFICNGGASSTSAFPSGTSFGAGDAADCTSTGNEVCCSGNGAAYNSNTQDCTCRA